MYCVYKHTSPSGKVYIGITGKNPVERWRSGKGYKSNPHFSNAVIKYGWDNFKHEILFDNLTQEEAKSKEIELITSYRSNESRFGYNRSGGGEPFFQGKFSKEARLKLSLSHKGLMTGEKNPMFGKGLRGSANGMYGKHHSDEWKKERSERYKGEGHPRFGVHLTDDEKRIQMLSQKTRVGILKCDIDGRVIEIYPSINEAGRKNGVSKRTIGRWCKSETSNRGYLWRYASKGGA